MNSMNLQKITTFPLPLLYIEITVHKITLSLKIDMKTYIYFLTLISLVSCKNNEETNLEINEELKDKKSVLVFSKTRGFRHTSIPDGIKAIQKLGSEKGFVVQTTEDAAIFNTDSLQKYSAVIFLSTSGDVINDHQQTVFEDYIQDGGGYVGIHSATDTENNWAWYRGLVGASFNQHPEIQQADLKVVDNTHTSTKLCYPNYGKEPMSGIISKTFTPIFMC
jgi:uncharacterized protein